jgi:N,N'-diacetylchitobiose phosphorylase
MRYGYFDDEHYEYVVERPDTPRSWSNYSGSPLYGAIITNNAGGYSFYRSAATGRFLRLVPNAIPMDQPGRYFYLRDRDSGDYWSASWQPVGKPLDEYKTACRFGTAYTVIESEYAGIRTESTYFVPLGRRFEYWRLGVTNTGDKPRRISVFTYCEFASEWNVNQDTFNRQYSAYITQSDWREGMVHCASRENEPNTIGDMPSICWLAPVGQEVVGYELDREAFLGPYRGYHNPLAVERGTCGGSTAYGDNACGCVQVDLDLAPGETQELLVLLGVGQAEIEGVQTRAEYGSLERASEELAKLKAEWHGILGQFVVRSPDADLDHMVNSWNAYNALVAFYWSRAASLIYAGRRDGFGYRDTVQDTLGVIPMIPEESRERLELMITGQESTGGASPLVKAFGHRPGHMEPTPPQEVRSDDSLWLFNTVPAYVAETGDVALYDKVLPYADASEDTVFGHLRRALEFTLERQGPRGLPNSLRSDWNDCLGRSGESLFVAFQLRYGLAVYADIAALLDRPEEIAWARAEMEKLDRTIQTHGWDGEWFVRTYRADGRVVGSRQNEAGRIFLNPQSWSVISGAATEEQARSAMDAVEEHLATEYGIALLAPAYGRVESGDPIYGGALFNPGQKENAAIFNHTQSWAVMADCILGNGDRAYRHYRSYMPSRFNDIAEVRQVEPYVHCQGTNSQFSPRHGAGGLPWLTGTVSWSYYTATQYILGIRAEAAGLRIDPCIPADWEGFSVRRVFRGKVLDIRVDNVAGVQRGVVRVTLNGERVEGNLIAADRMQNENQVVVVMGEDN